MTVAPEEFASVRYIVDDVPAAVDFYTTHLGVRLDPEKRTTVVDGRPRNSYGHGRPP